ncbi:MAG: hypothetical protein ACTS43_01485 [Candidatus Hodgkinia cicadicola]
MLGTEVSSITSIWDDNARLVSLTGIMLTGLSRDGDNWGFGDKRRSVRHKSQDKTHGNETRTVVVTLPTEQWSETTDFEI